MARRKKRKADDEFDVQKSPLMRFWRNVFTRIKPVHLGNETIRYNTSAVCISVEDYQALFAEERAWYAAVGCEDAEVMDAMIDMWNECAPRFSPELKPGEITFLSQPIYLLPSPSDTSRSRTLH